MSGFSDIPIRENGKDFLVTAEWWNTIRTKLIAAFGSGGYVKEAISVQSISAGGTITLDPEAFKELIHVVGNGGPVDLSLTPFGTSHGLTGGKEIILMGSDDTNTVTLKTNDAANGFVAIGKVVLSKYKNVHLIYSAYYNRFVLKE